MGVRWGCAILEIDGDHVDRKLVVCPGISSFMVLGFLDKSKKFFSTFFFMGWLFLPSWILTSLSLSLSLSRTHPPKPKLRNLLHASEYLIKLWCKATHLIVFLPGARVCGVRKFHCNSSSWFSHKTQNFPASGQNRIESFLCVWGRKVLGSERKRKAPWRWRCFTRAVSLRHKPIGFRV
jgi:hypothetical protein